ncbi:MAG: SMI1/KNR4 family protein [Candidatus Symbiopectobacterium sp. Dall1.0]|nr:SMI1/KNR4 family protein [Candidatus Symbiopectobacterium sp. Dall1.0]
MKKDDFLELVEKHSDLVNMGTFEDAPGEEWIDAAQKVMSVSLPEEYKWYLNNFGGGDICGEEIYSIYCMPFNQAVGGDIVYQNTIANQNLKNGRMVISNTDFGEEFFFDVLDMEKVYMTIGDKKELYANDFIEYLYKRLLSYI